MSIVIAIIISEIILNVVSKTKALTELPKVEDNHILKAGIKIRDTTNNLFSTLKFQGKRDNPDLKRLVLIHSYLVTLTSKDYTSLTKVAQLTRVDARNDFNVSANFIEILNEIVDNNANDVDTMENYDNHDSINSYINNYMQNLAHIPYLYSTKNPTLDINNELMHYFEEKVTDLQNTNSTSEAENDKFKEGLETWKPDNVFKLSMLAPNTRRIYQGKRTRIKHFPFMASVQIFDKFTCGSSIIDDDLVLTAASCLQLAWNNRFYRENPAFLSVRIGSTFFESGGEKVEVLEVYFHPSYDPGTLHNNLAIMRLVRKIKFSRKNRKRVMKIELDKHEHALPSNSEPITVIGWGAKTSSNVIHNAWEQRLSYDTMGIYGLQDCQDVYSKKYVTSRHFCAGYISKGAGACNRDVGGPGLVDGILVGVISFGSPLCGGLDSPTVFTKVGYYVDWIEEIMEQPVIRGKHRTTTLKPDFVIAWEHTTKPEGKPRPIYRSTTPTTESEEVEATTVKAQILEVEIQTLISKMLRKEKNEDGDSSDSSPENKLKTLRNKKTAGSALENQIMELIRASRIAKAATEIVPNFTVPHTSVNPTVLFDSSDDDDDYYEHPKKVTVLGFTRDRSIPANQIKEIPKQLSDQKIQPIRSAIRPKLNKIRPVPKFESSDSNDGDDENQKHPKKETVLDPTHEGPIPTNQTKKVPMQLSRQKIQPIRIVMHPNLNENEPVPNIGGSDGDSDEDIDDDHEEYPKKVTMPDLTREGSTSPNQTQDVPIQQSEQKIQPIRSAIHPKLDKINPIPKFESSDNNDGDDENQEYPKKDPIRKGPIPVTQTKEIPMQLSEQKIQPTRIVIYPNLNENEPVPNIEGSDGDGDEGVDYDHQEYPKKVTREGPTPTNQIRDLPIQQSEQKLQPIRSVIHTKFNRNESAPKLVQDMSRGSIFKHPTMTTNANNFKLNEQITIQDLQRDLDMIEFIENNSVAVKKQQLKRFKKPVNKVTYNEYEKITTITTSTQLARNKKLQLFESENPYRSEQLVPNKIVKSLRDLNLKVSEEVEEVSDEKFEPMQSQNPLQTSDVFLNLFYTTDKAKTKKMPKLTRSSDSDEEKEVNGPKTKGNIVSYSASSDRESNSAPEAEALSIHQDKASKLANSNKNNEYQSIRGDKDRFTSDLYSMQQNYTLQSLLSEKDLYEILSEALRDNLNLNLPEITTSLPESRKRTRRT